MRHVDVRLEERALPVEAERAYALLRNPAALRAFIGAVAQDCGVSLHADRLALPLGAQARGPVLIVTREGAPVTCLAEGMSTNAPVLPYREVARYLEAQEASLRRQIANARYQHDDGIRTTLNRVLHVAYRLTRPEFDALLPVAPLLADSVMARTPGYLDLMVRLTGRRLDLRKQRQRELAEDLWRGYAEMAFTLMLVAHQRQTLRTALSLIGTPDTYVSLRAWWILLNHPRELMELVERALADGDVPCAAAGGIAVAGVATRYPWLRREGEALARACMEFIRPTHPAVAEDVLGLTLKRLEWTGRRDAMLVFHAFDMVGHALPPEVRWHNPAAAPDVYGQLEDLATLGKYDLFRLAGVLHPQLEAVLRTWNPLEGLEREPRTHFRALSSLTEAERRRTDLWLHAVWQLRLGLRPSKLNFIAALTGAPPEALIPQAEPVPALRLSEGAAYMAEVLPGLLQRPQLHARREPVVASATVGRNEPCTCGSGKKFKKCCGSLVGA